MSWKYFENNILCFWVNIVTLSLDMQYCKLVWMNETNMCSWCLEDVNDVLRSSASCLQTDDDEGLSDAFKASIGLIQEENVGHVEEITWAVEEERDMTISRLVFWSPCSFLPHSCLLFTPYRASQVQLEGLREGELSEGTHGSVDERCAQDATVVQEARHRPHCTSLSPL